MLSFNQSLDITRPSIDQNERFFNLDKFKIHGTKLIKFRELKSCIEDENIELLNDLLMLPHEKLELSDPNTYSSVLHLAAKRSSTEILNILLSFDSIRQFISLPDIRGMTPLMTATWFENIDVALMLINNDATLHNENLFSQKTVLHYASMMKSSEICDELLKLNSQDYFINKQDSNGSTPLMLAVIANTVCVDSLLSKGVNIMKTNILGRNVLHMAVSYQRHDILRKLIAQNENVDFLNHFDVNGDSPLMLAIRMGDTFSFDSILESSLAHTLIQPCRPILHYLIDKIHSIEKIINLISDPSYFSFTDSKGRPFLINAAENGDVELVELLIKNNVSLKEKNNLTGETVLHVAFAANNMKLLNSLLQFSDISDLINVQDKEGQTPYDILLAKANHKIWLRFYKSEFVGSDYFNKDHESPLFIATKNGNYELILCLLLSKEFFKVYEIPSLMNIDNIILSEMKYEIFPSDVFIVLGIQTKNVPWRLGPSQEYLFETNNKNQNIFHACAISNNLEGAKFIYEYVSKFTNHIDDFDKIDMYGNTPLMLSLKYSSPAMTKFFLKHKADFGLENKLGDTSLDIITNNFNEYTTILLELLNECALIDSKVRLQGLSYGQLTLEYDILCPKKYNQMYFFDNIFRLIYDSNSHEILSHPVIEYFVLYKWDRIKDAIGQRFFFKTMSVVIFSIYLSYCLCDFLDVKSPHYSVLWWLTLALFLRSFLINLPLAVIFYLKPRFHMPIMLVSPILVILFLQMDFQDRLGLEIGAIATLFSWLSVFFQSVHTRISFQIAMFTQVLRKVIAHLPLCCLIIMAFSTSFFTLFNNYVEFNNPLHAFIQTSILLLQGQIDVPVFQPDITPVNSSFTMFNPMKEDKVNGVKDSRNMLVEGGIVLLFEILVTICILNMLIGLAVKSSEEIELEGQISNIRNYIEEISYWELLVETQFYNFFSVLKLEWLIGIPPKLKEKLKAPTTLYPFQEFKFNFDLYKLKRIAVEVSEEVEKLQHFVSLFRKLSNEER